VKGSALEIGKRIRKLRKEEHLTQAEFGERIGVKSNTVTGYESGTRRPSDSVLNYICLVFDVNQTWLRTGEGDMYIPIPDFRNSLEVLLSEEHCNNIEIRFLRSYFGLKKNERKAFCELLTKMFPEAIHQIVGDNPLSSPYDFEEAPPLVPITDSQSTSETQAALADVEALAQKAAEITREQAIVEKKPDVSVSSVKESDVG